VPDAFDLYALPPEQFTAERDAAVKRARAAPVPRPRAAGARAAARALAALRRPTVPAHLVNLLVRCEGDLVDQLLGLGVQLAEAQREGSGDALRALGEQRRALVAAVTGRAAELSGRDVTAAVRAEVEATLEAALADSASAEAVRSGRLVRALSFAGFGGTDLEGAVAPPAVSPSRRDAPTDPSAHRGAVAATERAAQEAAGRLDDAVRTCEAEQGRSRAAQAEAEQAAQRRAQAERALAEARIAEQDAQRQAAEAAAAAQQAADAVREAQDRAQAARAELDRLRRGTD
jgi:hypothetical protein